MKLSEIGIIIQARTSSTRFPRKIIKEFDEGNTFLDVLLERLVKLSVDIPVILATTNNIEDKVLAKYGDKYNIPVFFGSEHNVLNRFIACAEEFNLKTIIRICSDNPFLDLNLVLELIENYQGEDYMSFKIRNTPSILTHNGFFSELVSLKALKKVEQKCDSLCVEHVTNCIYSNPEEFSLKFIEKEVPDSIRCTLDTERDFESLKFIYFNWYKSLSNKNFKFLDLVAFLEFEKTILTNMHKEIIKNTK